MFWIISSPFRISDDRYVECKLKEILKYIVTRIFTFQETDTESYNKNHKL